MVGREQISGCMVKNIKWKYKWQQYNIYMCYLYSLRKTLWHNNLLKPNKYTTTVPMHKAHAYTRKELPPSLRRSWQKIIHLKINKSICIHILQHYPHQNNLNPNAPWNAYHKKHKLYFFTSISCAYIVNSAKACTWQATQKHAPT